MDHPQWNRSDLAKERLWGKGLLKMHDGKYFYAGRPLIHHDSPIDGGVYVGGAEREAVVVDFDQSSALKFIYRGVLSRCIDGEGAFHKSSALGAVYNAVESVFPPRTKEDVEKLIQKLGVGTDGKVSLDVFLQHRTGWCTHRALTAAALLERLVNGGYLSGTARVCRAETPEAPHAWCEYTNSHNQVFLIDHLLGGPKRLTTVIAEGKTWYARPENDIGTLLGSLS